ncbi:MAG: lipopolysaccharide biosynthesis protein [Flavobacteriia bacterium]|jgi:O-antigen/teichoic acid export membrane protein
MGFIQKHAFRSMLISYVGLVLGYLNKAVLFLIILSTEQIGLVNLILSLGLLFSQLSNLGTINAVIKFLPFFKNNELKKSSFFNLNLKIVIGGIILFSLSLFLLRDIVIDAYSEKSILFVQNYFWVVPIGVANVFFVLFESYLRAHHKNVISVFLNDFLLRLFVTILLFLLWFKWIDFNYFLVLHCLIYFIPTIVLLIVILNSKTYSLNNKQLKLSSTFKKIIINYSLFSYTNTLGILIVTTMDTMMIAYYNGLGDTGVYTTILYLISALTIPYRSLVRVSEPLIPKYWKEKNYEEMENLYRKVSSISLIIILYMFMLIWLNRNELFSLLKTEYLAGIWVFFFLMIGKIIDMYFGLNGLILVTSKKYKYDMIFTLSLLVIVFTLNCFLIPIYGMVGAAISTSFALLIYNFGRMIFVFVAYKMHPFSMKQIWVFVLFGSVFSMIELLPAFSQNKFLILGINTLLISLLFLGSVFILKLEPEINSYIKKGFNFVFKILKK